MADVVRILICDDHARVRSGLRELLESEPDLTVIGEAASAAEAIALSLAERPTILLLDIVLPGRTGIDALPDLLAASPATKILMLSMQDDPGYVRQAFAAGASGYLLKEAADTRLVPAIRAIAAGGRYVDPLLGARLAASDAAHESEVDLSLLSKQERQVLRRLAQGHTNQEIAGQLSISILSAETVRARIAEKLGLKTRAEIARSFPQEGSVARRMPPVTVPTTVPDVLTHRRREDS